MQTSMNDRFSCWLLDSISNGLIILDNENRIKFANIAAKQMLQLENEVIGQELLAEIHEELKQIFHSKLKKAHRFRTEIHFVAKFHSPQKWIKVEINPTVDGASIQIRDTTSQKEVEYKIHENHKKLVLLTEAANHIIFNEEPKIILDSLFRELSEYLDLDVYFNYIFVKEKNRLRLMNYSGIDHQRASDIEWLEFGEAVCGTVAQIQNRMVVEDVQSSEDNRVNLIKSLGIKSYACHPLLSYGRLIGTLSFGSSKRSNFSLEELELMETICNQFAIALERSILFSELRNKNTELTAIINGATEGIILLDAEKNFVNANPAACHLLGLTETELLSKKVPDVAYIKDIRTKENEVTAIIKNSGAEQHFEYSVTNEIIPGHKLIIFRDVTAKKQVANAIIEAKELAEQASQAKSEFLSRMSHELRTPLNSIIGFSQILLDDIGNGLKDVQRDRIQRILLSGRHLIKLINEILDHSQIEAGKLDLTIDQINLNDIIEETIQLFPTKECKGIQISNTVKITSNVKAIGDATRIKQVIINLLSNAIKYNKPNGEVTICSEISNNKITVFINDTGIGIPDDKKDLIFEPFYRIYHPEHNIEGTGIGLTLVKNLITMMGGSVGVSSTESVGSSFWFSLPISN
jgi:PAS domain S-box-containing protein